LIQFIILINSTITKRTWFICLIALNAVVVHGDQNILKVETLINGICLSIVVIGIVQFINGQKQVGHLEEMLKLSFNMNLDAKIVENLGHRHTQLGDGIAVVMVQRCINVVEKNF
jgi:hypothetical protein